MTLFRLDASIRVEGSHSREIADVVESEWRTVHPDDHIVRRHVGTDPIPATVWGVAALAGYTPEDKRTDEQKAAVALAAELVDELVSADGLLFAVPLYNFGVSQHFKTWFDLIMTDPRVRAPEGLLPGKPVVLATVRGGAYGPGTPKHGWDYSTPFLRRMITEQWGATLTVVERELTLAGVNPAMEPLRELAAQAHTEALNAAREAGRAFGMAPEAA